MAKELTTIRKEEEQEWTVTDTIESPENREAIEEIFQLLVQLQKAGVLNGITSFLIKKDDIAEIAMEQLNKGSFKQTLNTLMDAGKLLNSVQSATDALQQNKTTSMIDLLKVLKDPDINRAITFGLEFLKAFGKELKGE